jgi:hypothetical protein
MNSWYIVDIKKINRSVWVCAALPNLPFITFWFKFNIIIIFTKISKKSKQFNLNKVSAIKKRVSWVLLPL